MKESLGGISKERSQHGEIAINNSAVGANRF